MGNVRAPRAKDVAAALALFGVECNYLKSPKGSWVVALSGNRGFILPLDGGKFVVAAAKEQGSEVDGTGLMTWVVNLTA